MTNIAILGFGTVGGGVYEAISRCSKKPLCDVNIKYILDLRTFEGHPLADRVTTDFDKIINDESVSIVVETMGGDTVAYKFSLAALKAGKSVVTSNKAVVDKYGRELEEAARENGAVYLYEASVGGGIPIIAPLNECFASDDLVRVAGILNGTTNYILTHMQSEGKSLAEALKSAQELGYAEADPHADI
ncbi:MAG: homoserine dehydrogenase, partial [Clostridia bacterium]|nr:homoserine dehydrogenase [Clostridia bacterium]